MPTIPSKEIYLVLIFLIMVIASGIDLFIDFSEGTNFTHAMQEAIIVALSLIALAWLLFDIRRQGIEIEALRSVIIIKTKT